MVGTSGLYVGGIGWMLGGLCGLAALAQLDTMTPKMAFLFAFTPTENFALGNVPGRKGSY